MPRTPRRIALALAALLAWPAAACAQSLYATVNGDPVTSLDIAQRIKFLHFLRRPASAADALESIVDDRLKFRYANKFGIDANDAEIVGAAVRDAAAMKMEPRAFQASLNRSGIDPEHFKFHWRAISVWAYYVRALNKSVGVSEAEVQAELDKRGPKAKGSVDYSLRQIVFVVPANASQGRLAERGREAQQLRARFTDCSTGLQLARALPDVAVKEPFTRNSSSFTDDLRKILDQTTTGRLTPPSRGATGIEVVAVCDRSADKFDSSAKETISNELLAKHLDVASARLFTDIRKTAVIVKK